MKMRVTGLVYYLLPVSMRVPLKFGTESIESVNCRRVQVTIVDAHGQLAIGCGETPLSVTWAWPSTMLSYADRYEAMTGFASELAADIVESEMFGHPHGVGTPFDGDVDSVSSVAVR
jgi:hypothetical protein